MFSIMLQTTKLDAFQHISRVMTSNAEQNKLNRVSLYYPNFSKKKVSREFICKAFCRLILIKITIEVQLIH